MQELAWFGWGSIWAFSVASSGDDPSSSADLRVVITITELGFLSPSADSIHTCCCLVSLLCLLDFMFQFSTSYISLLWSVNCSNWLLIDTPLTTAQIPERLDIQDEEEEVLELLLQPHWNPTAVTHPLPQFASPVPAALFTHLACLRTCWLACSPSTASQLHMPPSDPHHPFLLPLKNSSTNRSLSLLSCNKWRHRKMCSSSSHNVRTKFTNDGEERETAPWKSLAHAIALNLLLHILSPCSREVGSRVAA